MRTSLTIGKLYFSFNLSVLWKGNSVTTGWMNRTGDGQMVLFLDYDLMELDWVLQDVDNLAHSFKLSHFFIYQSSRKGFHAVCLDKLSPSKFVEVMRASNCDPVFKQIPSFTSYRSWVLRVDEKGSKDRPRFVKFLKYPYKPDSISTAHMKFIHLMGPSARHKLGRQLCRLEDGNKHLDVITYRTGSRVIL